MNLPLLHQFFSILLLISSVIIALLTSCFKNTKQAPNLGVSSNSQVASCTSKEVGVGVSSEVQVEPSAQLNIDKDASQGGETMTRGTINTQHTQSASTEQKMASEKIVNVEKTERLSIYGEGTKTEDDPSTFKKSKLKPETEMLNKTQSVVMGSEKSLKTNKEEGTEKTQDSQLEKSKYYGGSKKNKNSRSRKNRGLTTSMKTGSTSGRGKDATLKLNATMSTRDGEVEEKKDEPSVKVVVSAPLYT